LLTQVRQLQLGATIGGSSPAGSPPSDPLLETMDLVGNLFRVGLSRAAVLPLGDFTDFDVPAAGDPKNQPQVFTSIVSRIVKVFDYLRNTPFDATRSLFDVTTVLVGSEFGRTLRQENMPIDNTGTDHNALCNSFLLAGKGIRSGLVLGASDFRSSAE